jgi:hypothetical protein
MTAVNGAGHWPPISDNSQSPGIFPRVERIFFSFNTEKTAICRKFAALL